MACLQNSTWLSGMWLVFAIAVTTAEMHHPPHCAQIHCLVSINIQQMSTKVSGCHFFCMDATLLHPCQTPFSQTTPLLPSVPQQQNVTEYWQEDSTSAAIPPTSISNAVGQHHKIGGAAFRGSLVSFI